MMDVSLPFLNGIGVYLLLLIFSHHLHPHHHNEVHQK